MVNEIPTDDEIYAGVQTVLRDLRDLLSRNKYDYGYLAMMNMLAFVAKSSGVSKQDWLNMLGEVWDEHEGDSAA